MGRAAQSMEYAPVGQVLNNGYDAGGSRIYPFSRGLAIQPNAQYSSYIGSPGNGWNCGEHGNLTGRIRTVRTVLTRPMGARGPGRGYPSYVPPALREA